MAYQLFSATCDQILDRNQFKEGQAYSGSQLGLVHNGREGRAAGTEVADPSAPADSPAFPFYSVQEPCPQDSAADVLGASSLCKASLE